MPTYNDDEADVDSTCEHCECWPDGGDCCNCGEENSSWDGDEDEEASTPARQTIDMAGFDDNGDEELKD